MGKDDKADLRRDYGVETKVTFRLGFGSQGLDFQSLSDFQEKFVKHVQSVYEKDDILGDGFVHGGLNFQFEGKQTAYLEYVFECHVENAPDAESFSKECVEHVKSKLEGFGCQVSCIDCAAFDIEKSWYNWLEETPGLSGPKAQKDIRSEDRPPKGRIQDRREDR